MGWSFREDSVIVEEEYRSRFCCELYQAGTNNVPNLFFQQNEPYGECISYRSLVIPKDRYMSVSGELRNLIKSDLAYKRELHSITWSTLKKFSKMAYALERGVKSETVTPEFLDYAVRICGETLGLCEFNGALPVTWYRSKLEEISAMGPHNIELEHFYYSEVMPHRLLVRMGKLLLLKEYFSHNGQVSGDAIEHFIRRFGLHDPEWSDPLALRQWQRKEYIVREIQTMAKQMSMEMVKFELDQLISNRIDSTIRYRQKLAQVAENMLANDRSKAEIYNFISALAVVSLATTEEEYRHIIQDHFWRSIGQIARALDLPTAVISREDLLSSFAKRRRTAFHFSRNPRMECV
ncbi:hypothetical protein [Paenibacillus sp. MMS18-CY102]|uniref:hypothetical protein n=1 Tax=Paenibacillus sp. MMS18-CY102 TaxID=2682849 RepID=UPI0013665E62|nr:hypothetical protein [Paenibacillus sp. MMS18-CY102]MWC27628.1 hypothetical protein [Paenibacillus sp. MMS18-CY102]